MIEIVQHEQSNHQENGTHSRGEECLLGGGGGTGFLPVESNQQIGTQAHNLPENEQPEETVRQNHSEHAHTEEQKFSEESMVSILVD